MTHSYKPHLNFFDPLWTSDGKPFAPEQFKAIVKDRYLISKNMNTSYSDVGEITPTERAYLMQLLVEDAQKQAEIIDRVQQQ